MPTFNNEASLRAFPGFQILDDRIQSIVLQMLKDDRLNSYGGLKRPPNAWLIFRSDTLAANPEMGSMSQAEVTVRCKSRWAVATPEERMELQARAREADDALLQFFPDYSYKPMSAREKERWKELGAYQRKDFWLSSAVRIAERIANPSKQWDGFLTLEKWAENHTPAGSPSTPPSPLPTGPNTVNPPHMGHTLESVSPPPTRLASRSQRVCNKPSSDSTDTLNSTTDALSTSPRFHPYGKRSSTHGSSTKSHEREQARIQRKASKKALLPGYLRDVLVHIGPQSSRTKRRRLVLSMFQLKDKMLWVSEEVDDDVPEDVFNQLSNLMSPDENSPDHLVLSDYTDPWIPEAMDEHGELFYPEIESVSEYYEYMAAYYSAEENSSDFIWPLLPRSPSPSLSPPSAPEPHTQSTAFVAEVVAQNSQSPSLPVDPLLDFSTEISPPETREPLSSTSHLSDSGSDSDSDSDSDSVTTPEDDLGLDGEMPVEFMEDFGHGGLEDFDFDF